MKTKALSSIYEKIAYIISQKSSVMSFSAFAYSVIKVSKKHVPGSSIIAVVVTKLDNTCTKVILWFEMQIRDDTQQSCRYTITLTLLRLLLIFMQLKMWIYSIYRIIT